MRSEFGMVVGRHDSVGRLGARVVVLFDRNGLQNALPQEEGKACGAAQ